MSNESSRYRTDSLFGLSNVLPVYKTSPAKAMLTLTAFTLAKSIIIPLSFHLARKYANPVSAHCI
jgi:hypothetical protein